jgi:hypothetical protein
LHAVAVLRFNIETARHFCEENLKRYRAEID